MIGEIDVRDTICPSEAKAFANALMKSVCLTHTRTDTGTAEHIYDVPAPSSCGVLRTQH